MIEKLDLRENAEIIPIKGSCHDYCLAKSSVLIKINEIIDLLNAIVVDVDGTKCVDGSKAPVDPYAEQRRWIGKLCWYKLCEGDTWKVGRLEKIQENADAGYPFVFDGLCYKICEPVKPDDDIIYRGE